MLQARPEELTILLHDVVNSDGDEHAMRLRFLVREVQELVAGPFDAYHGYDELFAETFSALDRAGILCAESFRHAVEATAESADGPLRLIATCAETLSELADVADGDPSLRELGTCWRRLLATVPEVKDQNSYASVAEVAAHFGVTPQAVYRWIDKGKVSVHPRPGGSYRIPTAQFDLIDAEALNAATRQRPQTHSARWQAATKAARPDRPQDVDRLDPRDPLAGL
ncbi:MAG TPA: helix-turn-helix domain-containing protein [Solirubrobacteraceae bacterium]|nr:helix-turn-helix domain-containing protein [Solirubrobacteraceae bacterium]